MSVLLVALGGAAGAVVRYLLGLIPVKEFTSFPIITLLINALGAFAIGIIAAAAQKYNLNENLVLFIKVGVCGGFTTFSTFSLEAYNLFLSGKTITALCYIMLSVVLCVCAVLLSTNVIGGYSIGGK